MSFLPVNGSPICTVGRLSASSSESSWLARTLAPPMPSRPVVAPKRTTTLPASPTAERVTRSAGRRSDAHRVHERVVRVRGVEERVAAHGRHAYAVAVVADPRDRAGEGEAGLTEAQAVEKGDRPRSHRDDVAEDAANARRRALERLDGRGVVVALDLEGDGLAVAEGDDAGVLAGPLQHALALGGQAPEQRRRVLVGAVLRPEQGEDRELEVVRRAAEELLDLRELAVGEAERAVERRLTGCRNRAQRTTPR